MQMQLGGQVFFNNLIAGGKWSRRSNRNVFACEAHTIKLKNNQPCLTKWITFILSTCFSSSLLCLTSICAKSTGMSLHAAYPLQECWAKRWSREAKKRAIVWDKSWEAGMDRISEKEGKTDITFFLYEYHWSLVHSVNVCSCLSHLVSSPKWKRKLNTGFCDWLIFCCCRGLRPWSILTRRCKKYDSIFNFHSF